MTVGGWWRSANWRCSHDEDDHDDIDDDADDDGEYGDDDDEDYLWKAELSGPSGHH